MAATPQTCAETQQEEQQPSLVLESDVDGLHTAMTVTFGDQPEKWKRGLRMISQLVIKPILKEYREGLLTEKPEDVSP